MSAHERGYNDGLMGRPFDYSFRNWGAYGEGYRAGREMRERNQKAEG